MSAKTKNTSKDSKMSATATVDTPKPKKTPEQRKAEREERKAARKAEREAAKSKMVPFRTVVEPSNLNSEGLLTSSNVAALGFDENAHLELGRDDFASESIYMVYRAGELRAKAARLIEKADQLERDAANTAQVSDPTKRAAIKKVSKMVGALAELQKQLESEGIDIAEMLKKAGMGGTPTA